MPEVLFAFSGSMKKILFNCIILIWINWVVYDSISGQIYYHLYNLFLKSILNTEYFYFSYKLNLISDRIAKSLEIDIVSFKIPLAIYIVSIKFIRENIFLD